MRVCLSVCLPHLCLLVVSVCPSVCLSRATAEGDRKVNIDILEANKGANREDIRRLRDDNKELRQKLAQMQRVRVCLSVCLNL